MTDLKLQACLQQGKIKLTESLKDLATLKQLECANKFESYDCTTVLVN